MSEALLILGTEILPGSQHRLNLNRAKLYSATNIDVPVIIQRAKKPGPVVLFCAGIHGDEINGIEIVRHLIAKKINKPTRGTIICIPVINIFGFLQLQREFPDGRDLNRVFPGRAKGSLASRFAYQLTHDILPVVDYVIDFHTGGAQRFNAPHIRVAADQKEALSLADVFSAPFTYITKNLKGSFRKTCANRGVPYLLYEGGKSGESHKATILTAVDGVKRILHHLDMSSSSLRGSPSIKVVDNKWLRAKYSGLLHPKVDCGAAVSKGQLIATITDPYGQLRYEVRCPKDGYLININQSPLIYQGDAIFNLVYEG